MSDITDNQRRILIAILQNKRIERYQVAGIEPDDYYDEWVPCEYDEVFYELQHDPRALRVASNQQDGEVWLYGTDYDEGVDFVQNKSFGASCYIDITPYGFISGGKIGDV